MQALKWIGKCMNFFNYQVNRTICSILARLKLRDIEECIDIALKENNSVTGDRI
jgi:hypothetical protein